MLSTWTSLGITEWEERRSTTSFGYSWLWSQVLVAKLVCECRLGKPLKSTEPDVRRGSFRLTTVNFLAFFHHDFQNALLCSVVKLLCMVAHWMRKKATCFWDCQRLFDFGLPGKVTLFVCYGLQLTWICAQDLESLTLRQSGYKWEKFPLFFESIP